MKQPGGSINIPDWLVLLLGSMLITGVLVSLWLAVLAR